MAGEAQIPGHGVLWGLGMPKVLFLPSPFFSLAVHFKASARETERRESGHSAWFSLHETTVNSLIWLIDSFLNKSSYTTPRFSELSAQHPSEK